MKNLKVLTLNCFGAPHSFNRKKRFKELAKEIPKLDLDLITLQEVYFPGDRIELTEILEREFKNYSSLRKMSLTSGGLLTFVRQIKSEYIGFTRFAEQGPIAFLPLFDRLAIKGFQHVKITFNSKTIDIVNAHFLCVYKEKANYIRSYKKQMSQLRGYLQNNCGDNLILTGDLNIEPDHQEILELKAQFNLSETLSNADITVSSSNTNRKGMTNFYSKYKSLRTDYVLANNIWKTSQRVIFDSPVIINSKPIHLSDHFGILAEISV